MTQDLQTRGEQRIDEILINFASDLRTDFQIYKNHCTRVFLFSLLQMGKTILADDYSKLSVAAAFHDLAIWTSHTFDYLQPSIELAKDYLEKTGFSGWQEEISQIILNHHKITPCPAPIGPLAEVFRRADWYDVFLGWYPAGINKPEANQILRKYPRLGFHGFLVKQTWRQFLKTPLSPLPMFKW